ncbi:MAG: DUF4159 domain-containing protein [Kiritimatiellia bacterium]
MKKRLWMVLSLLLPLAVLAGGEDDWLVPLGRPPRAAPKHISGGEGVPPLPLPATPLRRTERKRTPRPPQLIGKVVWGETAEYRYAEGQTAQVSDWNTCPDDVAQLLRKSGAWFGLNYGSQPVSLATFDPDPATVPVLFLSGVRRLRLGPGQLEGLRKHVALGGMVVFDSIAGSPYFTESAREVARQIVPGEPIRRIPLDHPIFHMLQDATEVVCPKNCEDTAPLFEGIYRGSRIACLLSPRGLGCGWDDHEVPLLGQAVYYDVDSATRLGVNLVAYAVGYAATGRQEARPELFGALDEQRPTDELVFAQIRHGGAWNVHPGAAAALLRRIRRETALGVSLKRIAVDPATDDLSALPFLYLEGLDDFAWSDEALAGLRVFLERGGTLVVNNGLGLATFDAAARRELARLLPGSELEPVAPDHPVFSAVVPVERAQYSPAALALHPELDAPLLEGIEIDGDLRVIYSPFDLACAWQGCDYPLALCHEAPAGLDLGLNLLVYAMTH